MLDANSGTFSSHKSCIHNYRIALLSIQLITAKTFIEKPGRKGTLGLRGIRFGEDRSRNDNGPGYQG